MRFILLFPALALCQPAPTAQNKASFEGVVVNTVTGEPVRKARLTLRVNLPVQQARKEDEHPPVTVLSDAAGKFEFTNLDAGAYQLSARRDGFANAQYGVKGGRPGTTDPIILGANDHKIGFTVKMTPFGIISGRVVDEDGDPIRGIQVSAMTYQYTSRGRELIESRNGTTDDLGQYRIFDLPQGKYFVKTVPRNRLRISNNVEDADSYMSVYYPGVSEANGANALEIGAGRQLSGIEFMLRKARYATIRGRVIAPQGATNISAGLMTVTDGGSSSSSGNTNGKDGAFEFVGIAPGSVYVLGSYVFGGQRHSAQVPVQVTTSDITGVELSPVAPMEVTGHVRIEGQSATKLSQIQVDLRGPGRSYGSEAGGVNDEGRLTFRSVEPNVYKLVPGRLTDLYVKSVQWGNADVTDGEVNLSNGVPPRTELAVVLGSDGGQLEGVVEKTDAPSITVTLVPVSGRRSAPFFKTATTNESGRYTIKGIAPGSYKVYAWEKVDNNAVIYDPDFLTPYDSLARKIEVAANEKKALDLKPIPAPSE